MKNKKTTYAAIFGAVALFGTGVADILEDGWQLRDIGLIIAALGVAAGGYFARDFDVSSEGEKLDNAR